MSTALKDRPETAEHAAWRRSMWSWARGYNRRELAIGKLRGRIGALIDEHKDNPPPEEPWRGNERRRKGRDRRGRAEL